MAEPTTSSSFGMSTLDMWKRILAGIPTLFGRLVYLASLRGAASGCYRHEALDALLGPEDGDRTLRRCHSQIFSEWLACPLAEQKRDLDQYLSGVDGPRHFSQFESLIPATSREVERRLFLADLETLMDLLRWEPGNAPLPHPGRRGAP